MEPLRFPISSVADVERVRREARSIAAAASIGEKKAEELMLSVSELASNLLRYARDGEILLSVLENPDGIEVESLDRGPGIESIDLAMTDGYSTGGGLGSGLPAAKRMMDEFTVQSSPEGTSIVARKWKTPR